MGDGSSRDGGRVLADWSLPTIQAAPAGRRAGVWACQIAAALKGLRYCGSIFETVIAVPFAGHLYLLSGASFEIFEVLIGDVVHLAVCGEQHVLGSALDARDRAIVVGHLALAFGGFFMLRLAQRVANLPGKGLFGGERRRENECGGDYE